MGTWQQINDQHWHQASSVIFHAEEAFQVQTPRDITQLSNVGRLVEYIAEQRKVSPNTEISVPVPPPFETICREAFKRLKAGLIEIGGGVPESLDSKTKPEELVPRQNRHEKWTQLAERLQCELPGFDNPPWTMWFSLVITYPLVCIFMVLLLTPVFGLLGIAEHAPWYVKIILGPMIFIGTLFLGAVAGSKAESLLFRNPTRIHFESIRDFASHIALNARGVKESLEKSVSTTINEYVRQAVAKEYGLTPDQIGDDFQLLPTSTR